MVGFDWASKDDRSSVWRDQAAASLAIGRRTTFGILACLMGRAAGPATTLRWHHEGQTGRALPVQHVPILSGEKPCRNQTKHANPSVKQRLRQTALCARSRMSKVINRLIRIRLPRALLSPRKALVLPLMTSATE